MNALDDLLKKKTGGSRTASSGSASGEKPVSYVDALLESKKGGNADSQLLYTNALKASQGQSTMQTPYADAAAQMKSGTNNNFFHGIAGIFEKAAAGAKEGLRTDLNEAGYRAQAANPLNAADDAYYKAMWEQTTGRKTGIEIPADTRTQQQKDLDEYMGVADLKNDRARAMQRAAEKEYERLDKEGVKTAFQRDNTYQERVDQRYADLGPKWQRAMSIAESVGNQALPMAGRLIGTALLGEKGGEAFQSFLFFNQASGAAIEEALEDGASWDKALTYGTVIGSIEAATEAAGDMANKLTIKAAGKYLPKEQFTKALIGTLTSSKTMRTVLTLLGQMNGEGLEEVASDLVSPFAKSIYNGKTLGENWMDDVTIRGLWESYLAGAISGGFLSGIDGAVNGRFRAQNESYANETVNAKIEEARASMKENGLFNSETREKIIDAGTELGALETQQQTAAQEAREHMQMIREMQRALRGDVGAQERISRMQEGTYTTGAQNAPVGAQRAQNEGISTTPAAAINIQEGMNNGQSSYHREESGAAYVGSRGQAAEGAEGGLQALAGGRTEVQRGVGTDAQADLRQVTPAQLGIRDGGTETVTVVDAQKLGGEAKSAYDAVRETGLEPVAVRGAIQISNGYANAYTESGRVFFRVDAADSAGNVISPEMLVQHELFHNYASEEVIRATDEVIRESMTAEEYDAMRDAYKADYAGVYDFANMSVDEIERLLTEEIAADAYAGLNWFSGEAPVQEAVRTETERNAPARRAEAQRETTGPPKGRASIVTLPDGKKYVQADRQVIFGNDPSSWADQIEGYINRKIRNGEDVILTTDSGDVLKITKDTAGKASFRNYVTDESGRRRPMTDSEYETKLNAEAHIDELAKVSERVNKNARPDETSTDGRPIHGKFAENGWLYREAWFQDFDGQYYKVTISIADGNNGVVVYNVGKMEKRTSPARKHGSSDSVTETGAQQEKSSSTATIRQTEGNSQEKSSGRASVAGIRARTADRETLRRAEAMEKGGTDNETIRQETGWYRGMDGQWRFEIDDGDATFSRNGEAQYSTDNADYARYTQLMNRMLTGNLTEAEHAELLGLDKKHGGTKKELARRIDEGDATLRDIMQHNALFEAYPEIAETKVKFAYMPNGTAGSYSRETNTITIDAKLKYDANEALDVLMHEVQHRVQAAEGFASGTNPGYWNRGENYDRAAEKYRDNRARLLNGLSTEDRALYDEYRSTEREMGAMFDGSMLYDESRMDALEKRSDELYKQLYGKEWFGKLNRYDRILGDAGEAVNEFYRNTAGEIEARDTASRRRMTAEERKNTPPNLGDADTVFADGNATSYSIDENFGKNVDDWVRNTPTDMLSTSPGYFRAGTTSEALQSIGARTDNIYMRKSKIGTIFEDHPEVNVDVIKKVPSILENPVLIMKSLTRPDSIVLLSEEKAKNGNSLMVALELTPKPGGRTEAEFSLVTSAYGRADENLRNLINNSELLYLDTNKNRANTWLMQLRVQFPSRQPPYGSIGNIAYAEDGVKITGKKLSELGGVIQKASSGKASVEVENRKTEVSEEDARRERLRKLQEADRRETERIRARENRGAGQRFVPNKSSGEVYRDLMGKGKSEVKVQMTGFLKGTPKDSTFKVEVKQTPIGKYFEATIFHDGHKADTLVRALKETAARDAAEQVITMANKNFSEENYQRAKKFEAEKTADEDARIAELFGDPEQPDNAETSRESSDAAETENAAAKETIAATTEKVTSEVIKAERNYREDFEKITSGAMRMFVNAGDTVRRIAKATGSKSLEGYYFNAGAYSQRAGNWIAKGGARTDIDGHRIGASLADTLAPMRKNETKYRDFQLYLLHMHNVDRMKYDNSAELERIKENLRWVKEKYPQLKELSKEELRRIANSDSDSPVVRQAAHEIYLAAHNGEAPSLTSVAEGAAYALELERQRAIVEKQGLKPVFGYDVTADDSQTAAMLLAAKNPEFKEWAKEVYKYSDDLIRYRVEAGLITREFADALKKRYPHYIPTFREEGTSSKKARSARRNGGIVVSNAIGRAVGSDGVLLPLHTALSRKTVSTMRNAGLNQFGLALVREYDGNKKATEKYIWDVAESEYTPTEAALESDEDYRPVFENIFSVKENGKAYDITMDEGLTAAMKAFEPDKFANYGAAKAMKKLNDVFKAMNTAWSPWFLIKNAVRDFQDAGFYSTDMKTWLKMFPQAKRQIRKNGEIWQQYKALGGSYSSMLDYTTGMVKEPKNKLGKLWARFELLQQQVEAAPRLAEFMTILANSGGSKDGKFTQNDLMEAMLGAADITTNFARGGSVTKMLNRYLVPFLNPSVQGFDKFIRNATGVRSVQAAGKLILSAALWGILPQILNELMWWDDDEWDDIPANTKSNYYLIKLPEKFFGSGYWVKIPKGRAAAVLGTLAVYGKEKIEGEDVKFSDVFEVIKSNIAPTDIFNQNIATAFTQTKLFNPDNPGTTWYGGNIESDRLQNYRPGDRYDEKTDELSKLIGKTFNLSPKKINYLLDQYTGIFGDILLPLMTPATNAASKLLSAPMAAFTIDTTSTNKTTGEYYDLLDDLKYDANDGDVGAGITRKYVSRAGDEVNDYYAQIRALQNDKNLSDGEKNRLVRALKKQLIERQKEIIAKAEPYREAVDKYLKAHPELATDNDAAIAEYAELYDITEDQAESRMDAIVYRECNREVFGAEYALRTYNADVYDKARTAYAKGVSYETYYDYYFATKEMHADKDENGKSISGSKKAKVVEYINSLDIPAEQKDALYVAAGYTEKSARYQKWNGGSGGSGSRRGSSGKTTLKAPTPKAGKIVIPEASAKTGSAGKSSGNALAPSSKTAKTSGNVIADFTQKSSGTDIRKAVTQAKKRAIKAGNRTLYVEEGSPIDYFLKYGKLPSVK